MLTKDDKRIDVNLDIESETFIEDLRAALGMKEGDELRAAYPIFNRTDDVIVSYIPNTEQEYDALGLLSDESLEKIGCQLWEDKGHQALWLFPMQWYEDIPEGYPVVTIMDERKPFKLSEMSCDARGGALAFGFIKELTL